PELRLPPEISVRFIFPNAPNRPVTVNGGMVMPAWYDIKGLDIASKQDRDGMQESFALVERLIDEQIEAGIDAEKIILAGFSQGGAVVLYTMLRSKHTVLGIMALSTYLPFVDTSKTERTNSNQQISIFFGHGTMDPVVPHELGLKSYKFLRSLGYQTSWHEYSMQHSVSLEEILDISAWLNTLILAPASRSDSVEK
ncbi:MAG: alpha/beta hydrolase fold domain-containing protein, partial [Proteobacteria bacterium]|nr:alpha/beta hydrolase fold domain-containing protein [Pseudomonadota bacterium]